MKLRLRFSAPKFLIISIPLLLLALAAGIWFALPWLQDQDFLFEQLTPVATIVSIASVSNDRVPPSISTPAVRTPTPTETLVPLLEAQPGSAQENLNQQGLMILAMRDGLNIHLFAYHPLYLPLTRLTDTPWDDITPALSPDGTRLAFSSRRNGYWDLFILDLTSGKMTRVTDTPDYEAYPTWSPDGKWLAYEKFDGKSEDIYLIALEDLHAQPERLTDTPGVNKSPAWSPQGRQIAFVSDRSGDEEIWLADLNKADKRFTNLSRDPLSSDRSPVWSGDGSRLAWASEKAGDRRLVVWNASSPDTTLRLAAAGDRPVWSQDGSVLFSEVLGPNQQDLAAYQAATGRLVLPLTPLPAAIYGMTWVTGPLPEWLAATVQNGDQSPAPILTKPILAHFPIFPIGRMSIEPLEDVTAPQPMLQDSVDEAFKDLRKQVGIETGWDALSNLENAFIPITTPDEPDIQDDWLYTGRAFAINQLLLSAGWMNVEREDYGGQTFWHVFLKARYQDGSMGAPLGGMSWDLNARYSGNPHAYEQGGRLNSAPPGYWIDLTELASRYGWERLASHTDWRTYYPSIQFNQFVMTGGLDWQTAMEEIYPEEALITATPRPTYTTTITSTPMTPFPTDTLTPSVTPVPGRRPTLTPLPNSVP